MNSSRYLMLLVLALFLSVNCERLAAGPRPNVLLICVDDLKPALGCYGDALAKTPNIDRLASRSVLFERAYCNQAVCAPSRNALMTGSLPTSLGIYDLGTNFRNAVPDAVTLTQQFKQQGYRVEGLGKIMHVGHGNADDPASWSVPHVYHPLKYTGNYALKKNAPKKPRDGATTDAQSGIPANADPAKGTPWEIADVADDAYSDGRIADEAVRRLRAATARTDEPFFLAVGFLKPHLPFCAPRKYWDMHQPGQFALAAHQLPPVGAPAYAPQFGGELRGYPGIPPEGQLPDDLQRTLIHGYYAAVSYMDAQVGKVLDELDRLQFTGNTIVVFWGDHGYHLGDHGMWCKHTNYEQATRIPLMISAPSVATSATRCSSLVETVDLYPTLCELAGLSPPQGPQPLDGVSLLPLLRDPHSSVKNYVRHAFPRKGRLGVALRTSRYRLVEWRPADDSTTGTDLELYDYETDPQETSNLAAAHPQQVAELRRMLAAAIPHPRPQIKASPGRKLRRPQR